MSQDHEGTSPLPEFLSQVKPTHFSDNHREFKTHGGLTSVWSFDHFIEVQGEEVGVDPKKFVVKKYDFPKPIFKKVTFGENYKVEDLEGQISILKDKHRQAREFFKELPDLIVPTQFMFSGKTRQDAHIYEIQRRVDGLIFADGISLLDIRNFISQFSDEQRFQLKASLEKIIHLFSNAIQEGLSYVPDMNINNFGIDRDGCLYLVDTNINADWSHLLVAEFTDFQEKQIDMLKTIVQKCFV